MPGARQPLLLLHGALGSREQTRSLGDALRRDYNVVEFDFPGHGAKAEDRAGFGIERFSREVCGFLDSSGISAADVFGYSMGGYVALHAARFNPGRIGRIMTLGTKFAWDGPTAEKEASRLDPGLLETKVPAFAAQLRDRHGDAWKQVVRATARMMLDLGAKPALGPEDFRSIPNGSLLAVGDRDSMVTVEETLDVYRNLLAGSFLVLPGTPHPFEQVETGLLEFHVRNFFAGSGGGPAGA